MLRKNRGYLNKFYYQKVYKLKLLSTTKMVELLKIAEAGIQDSGGKTVNLRDLELKLVLNDTYRDRGVDDIHSIQNHALEVAETVGTRIGADYVFLDVEKRRKDTSPHSYDPDHEFWLVTSNYYYKKD